MSAEAHFMIVHREMSNAPTEQEQQFPGITVAFVLLHSILHGLFGEAVLELEGGYWQAIDEKRKVQSKLCLIAAVT